MSLQPEYLASVLQRRYEEQSDRLFLVYYPLIAGYNANKWGVTEQSLDRNILSALNKPVVVYKKNPNNRFHTKQAGAYVHPTPEEAEAEIGHYPKASEYFQWQEKYAVGRVRNIDKRDKGYAFTLEITDPEVKNILKSEQYQNGTPGWTSPQIMFRGMDANLNETYDSWIISHIALVDTPAYGYAQTGARAKCLGAEKECMIQTRSASSSNLGFCVREATISLIDSHSSYQSQDSTSSHTKMSTNETPKATGETVTYAANNDNNTASTEKEEPKKQEQEQPSPPAEQKAEDNNKQLEQPKTLKEAQMDELIKDLQKQVKNQRKELDEIRNREKFARLSFLIPRDLFKSDDSHRKEVERTMNENVSEDWIIEFWKTKRELAMATQSQSQPRKMEEPLVAKSASLHEVPTYDNKNSSSQNSKSIVEKQLELRKMILGGN